MKQTKHNAALRVGLALLLVVLLTLSVLPIASSAGELPFTDVRTKDYFYNPVRWAYEEGITAGTSPDLFSPKRPLRFSEIATFLYRYAYSPKPHYSHPALAEYRSSYYYSPLNWCCDFGLISPAQVSGSHHPNEQLTRNEFVNILYRYVLLWEKRAVSPDEAFLAPYTDAPADAGDRAAWSWAVSAGVVSGTDPQKLSPQKLLSRAEFVTMLYRLETRPELLHSESLPGRRLRGWQRTLIAAGERAYGGAWVDGAYELGPDGVPTVIDCSGLVNWCFTVTGIRPYADLNCKPLWESTLFTQVFQKTGEETGSAFLLRCLESLEPGDLLFSKNSWHEQHVMFFLAATPTTLYVFHSRNGAGVLTEALPIGQSSTYIKNLYGVMRHIP